MPLRLHSFWLKLGLTVVLVALADLLLFDRGLGLNLGLVSLGLLVAAGLTNRGLWRCRLSVFAFSAAAAFALLQIERASFLGWLLFAVALGVAVLAPRAPATQDSLQWAVRLLAAGLKAIPGPVLDVRNVRAAKRRRGTRRLAAVAVTASLPIVGGAVFLWLFAQANPVIARALAGLRLPALDPAQLIFCGAVGFAAWTALRPRGFRRPVRRARARDLGLPAFPTGSVVAALVVFNAVFALQNGLDIAFLWSGAPLPDGVTLAEYAHQGAYPLIATALLAGLFVLVFLRPGAPTAGSGLIRGLVIVWLLQNVFLVASSVLRTTDYIDAYSLTRIRLAALIWMALVATGLVLIGWRLVRGKSGSWLVNANALAAALALALCSVVDLGAVAAAWNVRHAREVGGRGVEIDLCYLARLNGAALVSLAELEQRPLPPELLDAVRGQRRAIRARLQGQQSDWRAWRWRDARRLGRDAELPASLPQEVRGCDRRPLQRPRIRPLPLTPPANPGS